jgi:hypothetical protein
MGHRFVAGISVAAVALATSVAEGASSTSALSWSRLPGAESCPASRELAGAVEQRLKRAVFVPPSRADVTVEGYVRPVAPAGFLAVVHLVDRDGSVLGTRELEIGGADCGDLAAPLSLAVALMIDPDGRVPPIAAPPPETVRENTTGPDSVTPSVPAPGPPWRLQVDVGPAVTTGFFTGLAPGVEGRALLDPTGLPAVEVLVAHFSETTGSVGYHATYGGLGLCPLITSTAVGRLSACAGGAVGAVKAQRSGFAGLVEVIVHPFLEARGAWRLAGPVLATGGVSVAVPLARPTFNYGNITQIDPVVGTAALGIGVEVP